MDDQTITRRPGPDGISCVGLLFLLAMLLFSLGLALQNPASGNTAITAAAITPLPTATATPALPEPVAAQVTATRPPTWTPRHTATATNTPIPTATQTPTLPPSLTPTATTPATEILPPTATAVPTETLLPPTATPWPMPTPNGIYSTTVRVPILMYHYISVPPEDADQYRIDLSVPPDNFRAQMEYLAANGYTTVDLYDLTLAIVNQRDLPPNPVIITIDDGYRDFYDNGFPILRELGLKATLFVITDYVDRNEPNYVSWAMIAEMAAAGIRIEPHSKSHVNLNGRDRDFLVWEMLGSQQTVAAHIGYTPRYFAYPGGRYDEVAMQVLEDVGFWGSVTTYGGTWHNYTERFEWTRMRVRYTTTMPVFVEIVEE